MGEVQKLWIEGPAGRLEAALRPAESPRASAVIAHPHPLYGGTLHNPVVFHVDRELHRAGWTTLRFNFRGAGESRGAHDGGRGEVGDVGAAVSWLRDERPGTPLLLVGYSFGAWCGFRHALADPGVAGLVAIGLPLEIYPFESLGRFGRPLAVVQGALDPFGSPEKVEALLEESDPKGRLQIVAGADHFFTGKAPEAARNVVEAAERCLEDHFRREAD